MLRAGIRGSDRRALTCVATAITAMVMIAVLATPAAGSTPASSPRADAPRQDSDGPRAHAACAGPAFFLAPACAQGARLIVVKVAPKAFKGAKNLFKGSSKPKATKGRARVKSGAKRSFDWARAGVNKTNAFLTTTFYRLPRLAQGCAGGVARYTKDFDVSFFGAAVNCGRGIIDTVVLGKDPLRPVDG